MLDSAQASSLAAYTLLAPQVLTATGSTPSGSWVDMTQFEGYVAFLVSLGTITLTSVAVQLYSSSANTGASPVSGGAGALFPTVLAAASPATQSLILPSTFFANRYVGATATAVGSGNLPIGIIAVGGLRSP
jgi:hypothetical protein